MTVPSDNHTWTEEDEDEFNDNPDYRSESADLDDENEEGCEFPSNCCMPGFHLRSECYTPAMAEEWFREQENAA